MRAAQSKGTADLLALWPVKWDIVAEIPAMPGISATTLRFPNEYPRIPMPWLVQCKYSIHGGGYLPGKEAIALLELAALTGGLPVFARPGKNGRGVEFIDLSTEEPI